MANPQTEDGFTRIANEILEALIRANLSGHCFRLCLLVIRKTYGFGKKEDTISLSQMAKISGLTKSRCSQIINVLEDQKIITVSDFCYGLTKKYRFNKDFETWKTVSEKCYGIRKVIGRGIRKVIPQKKTYKRNIYTSDSVEIGLVLKLLFLIRKKNENFKQPDLQKWARQVDLMIRIDKRSPDDIVKIMEWCQSDPFWFSKILSTEKLRIKYDELAMQMIGKNGRHIPERTRYY